VHDREQILASQTATDFPGIRAGHCRIIGRDEQRSDRRIVELEQRVAEAQVIDDAWADSTDRRNTIFVGLSGDTETDPA